MWALVVDGKVELVRSAPPSVVDRGDRSGRTKRLTAAEVASLGWVEVTETDAPSPDHVPDLVVAGGAVSQVWRLDTGVRAARIARAARGQRRARLAGAVTELRAVESGASADVRVLAGIVADLIEELN